MANEATVVAKRPPRTKITESAIIVALMASLSALLIARIWSNRLIPGWQTMPGFEIVVPTLVPHLLVVALVAMRYARANAAAIVVGLATASASGMYAAQTRQP